MDLIARLDEQRRAIDVLEHPFYQRWSEGRLSAGELALYAGEYREAVVALANASSLAAAHAEAEAPAHAGALRRHAEEEAAHVALWQRFAEETVARAPEAATAQAPLPESEHCAQAWSAGEQLLEHLAVLYAIEASQPQIAQTKLDGLREHYGYRPEGPAVEYFTLHERVDREHARQAQELIVELLADCESERREQLAELMLARAGEALRGNWELLDGVEAAAAR